MNLKIDYCSHAAAKYACNNWHYSKSMPAGRIIKFGVWEDDKFIGCVLYSRGANNNMLKAYNLKVTQGCELTRVALTTHKTQVSKILSITIRLLRKTNPGLKLIVSYADIDEDHHGGIYQASNWICVEGKKEGHSGNFVVNGKRVHGRSVNAKYGTCSIPVLKEKYSLDIQPYISKGKYKYLYPLTQEMHAQVIGLSKPYPKRQKKAMDDLSSQRECDTHLAAPLKLTNQKASLEVE